MLTCDETVEDESHGNEGTRSQFSSDSELMLQINKLIDSENRTQDYILGNWIVAPSKYLLDFRPARHVGLPLAICSRTTIKCSNKLFLDIFSGRHHHHQGMITMTNIADLSDKYLAYSNDGWLLFRRPSCTGFGESLFLHHIVTGEHIDLPDMRGPQLSQLTYLFSTSSSSFTSSVDYVVNVTRHSPTRRTTIYVTRPHTRSWEVYTQQRECELCHKFALPSDYEMVAAIIFGKKVYVFDHSEIADVFDLVERRWWSVTGLQSQRSDFHVAESDGKIVKIYSHGEDLNRYRFLSLEWDDEEFRASWAEMSRSELENKSWFLGHLASRTWCMKDCQENGGQATVYRFTHERASPPAGFGLNIQVHDLKAGTTSSVLPFPVFSTAMCGWIDLGYTPESRV